MTGVQTCALPISFNALAQLSADAFGDIGPFRLAIALTVLCPAFVLRWGENYGRQDTAEATSFSLAWRDVVGKTPVLLLGLIQALFEGAMYTFVFVWVPTVLKVAPASHVDLWDHKPLLEKFHGTPLPGGDAEVTFQGKNGNLMRSPWDFAPAGRSGKMISTLLPHMARHVDDMAFVHSMTSRSNTHGPGCIAMNTGFTREGFPSAGAWISHGLGTLNENLPTFVALQDIRGEPPNGKANWGNGFLPAQHQAVVLAAHQPLRNLARPGDISEAEEVATRSEKWS